MAVDVNLHFQYFHFQCQINFTSKYPRVNLLLFEASKIFSARDECLLDPMAMNKLNYAQTIRI